MKHSLRSAAALTLAVLALSACGAQPESADDDRAEGAGDKPDAFSDTTQVTLYRNADNVPNVAYFCAGAYGWASTLSGTDSGGSKAAALVRFPEYDEKCAPKAR